MKETFIIVFIYSLIIIVFYMAGRADGYNSGYREGQIEILSGKASYLLMEKEDLTRYWKEVEPYPVKCSTVESHLSFYYETPQYYSISR